MRALWYVGPGRLEWRESPEPRITDPAAAIVRPIAVATCDLDAQIARGQTPAAGPFPVGHEFVGEVVEVGEAVTGVAPGDRVSVPFQISCGQCTPCRRGRTGRCQSVPGGSAYGMGPLSNGLQWGGAVADLVLVPYADAMCVPISADLDAAALAGLSDNLVDAWRTVAPYLDEHADARVLIFGRGSVGLYATGIARALGAEVTYVDEAENRCATAERLGARVICEPPGRKYPSHPVVVHTTAQPETLRTAVRSTSSSGVCTDVGIFFNGDVALPLLEMYVKGITFVTGRIDARATMPAALDLITSGRLDPAPVITETAPWDEAPAAWAEHTGRLTLTRT
jgi:threonine dehydrogenase-like Zn-dependent dehydrogenase